MAKAKKFDSGKIRYDLVPASELEELARVYTMGAIKYGDKNYLKGGGLNEGRVYAAIIRHIQAQRMGKHIDSESKLQALAHAAWGCFTLMEYERLGFLGKQKRKASKRWRKQ